MARKQRTRMWIGRIDVEGEQGRYAVLTRKRGAGQVQVEILVPENPKGRIHYVEADCEEDLLSMAECLKDQLRGDALRADYLWALRQLAD